MNKHAFGIPGLAFDRLHATKYRSSWRMYTKLVPSMSLMGGSFPVSFAAMTCRKFPDWEVDTARVIDA